MKVKALVLASLFLLNFSHSNYASKPGPVGPSAVGLGILMIAMSGTNNASGETKSSSDARNGTALAGVVVAICGSLYTLYDAIKN